MPIMEIEVNGNSGCKVEIIREDKRLYVLKSTLAPEYAARLVRQAHKQQQAAQRLIPNIMVPQVCEINEAEGMASVKMDYVYSKNYITFFENAGVYEIDSFIDAVIAFIENELSLSQMTLVDASVFRNKVDDIERKLCGRDEYDARTQDLFSRVRAKLDTLPAIMIPVGVCHGDLTFSNILFVGNNYCLIDFLDSFVETPLQDIVKLRQDSRYLWSCRMYNNRFDELRLSLISDYIDKTIDGYFAKYEWYAAYYELFQLINMLRILPYARDKEVTDFLLNVVSDLI